MRRILHHIAIAILTLVGPVEVVRTMTGPAQTACQCGCGAASEAACQCATKSPSTPAQSPAHTGPREAGGSSCSATNSPCSPRTSAASTGLAGKSLDRSGLDLETRPEPKPWSGTLASGFHEILNPGLAGRFREITEIQQGRPLDRLAKLAVFRI